MHDLIMEGIRSRRPIGLPGDTGMEFFIGIVGAGVVVVVVVVAVVPVVLVHDDVVWFKCG